MPRVCSHVCLHRPLLLLQLSSSHRQRLHIAAVCSAEAAVVFAAMHVSQSLLLSPPWSVCVQSLGGGASACVSTCCSP